jgi:GT2 family glycosyltransferase
VNTPAASIIIPVFDRTGELFHVLDQLKRQSRCDFEAVIVDDGSTTPVTPAELPGNLPFPLRILRHESRRGIGKARNTGIAGAQAELFVFIDSDGDISDEHWFEKHMDLYARAGAMAREAHLPRYVFHSTVSGISDSYWGRSDTLSNWFGSSMSKPCRIRDRHVPTHNTSVHREVFEYVGPFDESLEVCEDVEWSFRCQDRGVGLFFIPGALIGHFDRNTFRDFWMHYYHFGLYALAVRRKHPRSAYQWIFPNGPVSAVVLFLPLTFLMTLYITGCWIFQRPEVLLYIPGLHLANIANYAGLTHSIFNERRKKARAEKDMKP